MPKYKVVCLDFDGTCVANEYPLIGKTIGAEYWLKWCAEKYYVRYILWTMRTGKELSDALVWCAANSIPIWATGNNPQQARWSKSPKIYGNLYIEDTALGIPLTESPGTKKPFVNWYKVGAMFEDWCMLHCEKRDA